MHLDEIVTKYDLELIEWEDSCGGVSSKGYWYKIDDIEDDVALAYSVGWVIKETKKLVTIAPHVTDPLVCGEMTIPKKAIRNREKLTSPFVNALKKLGK